MTDLRLTNTQGGDKQVFVPADPSCVTMYVCGPTVYNLAHIGNARPVVVFDVLYRVLRALYPKFDDFTRLRQELDPGGRLLNPHLAKLFGVEA